MVKQKYNVTGMTCSACSAHVEKAVRGVQGVSEVSVNLLTNSMVVESDAPLEQDVIVKAVEHAGYGASPADGRAAGPAAKPGGAPVQNPMQAQLKNMRMRLWVSFAFLAPLMYVSMGSMAGLPLPGFLSYLSAYSNGTKCKEVPSGYEVFGFGRQRVLFCDAYLAKLCNR